MFTRSCLASGFGILVASPDSMRSTHEQVLLLSLLVIPAIVAQAEETAGSIGTSSWGQKEIFGFTFQNPKSLLVFLDLVSFG